MDSDLVPESDEISQETSDSPTAVASQSPGDVVVVDDVGGGEHGSVTGSGTATASVSEKPNRISRLPLTRIKNIMKTDPDVTLASQESVVLIAKATEMFLQHFSKMSYSHTARSKRKTIKRQDVDLSVDALDAYAFLEGMLE